MMRKYKTFEDLVFMEDVQGKSLRAVMNFHNGYSISVIKWLGVYGCTVSPYECACLWNNDGNTYLYQLPNWSDSVESLCNKTDVTIIMKQIQDLENVSSILSAETDFKDKIEKLGWTTYEEAEENTVSFIAVQKENRWRVDIKLSKTALEYSKCDAKKMAWKKNYEAIIEFLSKQQL